MFLSITDLLNYKKRRDITICRPAISEGHNNDLGIPTIKIKDMKLGYVHKYNYLGVTVDDKLLFDEFIDYEINNITRFTATGRDRGPMVNSHRNTN